MQFYGTSPNPISKRRADTSNDMYNPTNLIVTQKPPSITYSSPKSPWLHSPWPLGMDYRPDPDDSTT
jgi:hypothetical protein